MAGRAAEQRVVSSAAVITIDGRANERCSMACATATGPKSIRPKAGRANKPVERGRARKLPVATRDGPCRATARRRRRHSPTGMANKINDDDDDDVVVTLIVFLTWRARRGGAKAGQGKGRVAGESDGNRIRASGARAHWPSRRRLLLRSGRRHRRRQRSPPSLDIRRPERHPHIGSARVSASGTVLWLRRSRRRRFRLPSICA
jgi:hypothetical protein